MTFMLFTGTQPDWADMAQKLIPSSKNEILLEVIADDEKCMGGDSVRVLYHLDPKEYSYTNQYEFIQALNKYRGWDYGAIRTDMVDAVLPMVNLRLYVNEKADSAF